MAEKEAQKKAAAKAALDYIESGMIVGVGSGSTTTYFIEALSRVKGKIDATVASSKETEQRLKAIGLPVIDLNSIDHLPLYVDGADEFNDYLCLIKGGGGALTREKIIAAAAKKFICIVDESKHVSVLGKFPVAIEVIAMARSLVGRKLVQLGATPIYREGYTTDNGNIIIDAHNLNILEPLHLETTLNNLPGVVENGIFAQRSADKVLMGTSSGVKIYLPKK